MKDDLLQPIMTLDVEQACLQFLRCVVQEFAPEYVTVYLPRAWKEQGQTIPKVHNSFTTEREVVITVQYGSAYLSRAFPLVRV